jgi:hypothetical protein
MTYEHSTPSLAQEQMYSDNDCLSVQRNLLSLRIETIHLYINVFLGSTILRICAEVRGRRAIQIPASESLRT